MRCPDGTRADPKTGICDKLTLNKCPNGSRRDRVTKKCKKVPAKKVVKKVVAKKVVKKVSAKKVVTKVAAKKVVKKCPNGSKRDSVTKKCKKVPAKKVVKKCPNGSRRDSVTKKCKKVVSGKVSVSKSLSGRSTTVSNSKTPGVHFTVDIFPTPKVWCKFSNQNFKDAKKRMGFPGTLDLEKDLPTSKKPNRLCENFAELIDVACAKGWNIIGYLGKGSYGTTYEAIRKHDGKKGVVKIQTGDSSVADEIKNQRVLHSKNLAPEIFDYCSYTPVKEMKMAKGHTKVYVIFMGKVDGIVSDWLNRPDISSESIKMLAMSIFQTLFKLKKEGFTHGDFHIDNIGYVYTDSSKTKVTVAPIDFGFTYTKKSFMKFDLMQLVRVLSPSYFPKARKAPLIALEKEIRKIAESINIEIPKRNKIERAHDKAHQKYIRIVWP